MGPYFVIGVTVIAQGLSGGLIARLLNVRAEEKTNWLIVGVSLSQASVELWALP